MRWDMTWIKLGNPTPRDVIERYELVNWEAVDILKLPTPASTLVTSLEDVLHHRRTQRHFDRVELESLSTMLWNIFRPQQIASSDFGFDLAKRPLPSAGAIHPIHILINPNPNDKWYRYLAESHRLAGIDEKILCSTEIREQLESVLGPKDGAIFMFVAEPGKTQTKYHNPTSLIWRDAGVILGYLSVVAAALKLNFCPLGINGDPWAANLDEQGRLAGVGMAILGTPTDF